MIESKIGKVSKVENSAAKLADFLVDHLKNEEITFFCGNLRRDELPDKLGKNGIKIDGTKHDSHLLAPQAILSVGPHEFEALLNSLRG